MSAPPPLLIARKSSAAGRRIGLVALVILCLAIKASGGTMADVLVSGLDITGTRAPIFVRLGDRSRRFTSTPGALRNVTIEKVTARGAGELG